ncbi:MAG TPA: histidine kinase [Gemmatimonadaceae bacterium]|jgi:signal transduction histidine kinase|nr:histidine kinase [Gemmatimonadaceae bacterium]
MSASPLTDVDILRSTPTRPYAQSRTPVASESLAQTGEYSIFGLTRSVDSAIVRERQVGFTLILFGVATIIAILYSVERYFYSRLVGEPLSLSKLLPAELVFTYVWALLTPVVMLMAKRFPVRGGEQRARNWLVQLAGMIGFIMTHVGLCALAAAALEPTIPLRAVPTVFGQYLLSWTVLDAIVFCALVTVHHAVVYYRVSKDRALRASQLAARLAQAQLQMLRMQLQPHFLFNTLHSISALMHKDVRRADSMIAALSDLLRMSLQNIGAQEVPLQSELDFLQRYVEIMQLRFGERLRVSIDVEPETRDARVPNLFLQPLVENSFRHGFGDLGQGTIAISVRRDGDMLRCVVVDDGRGLRAGHKEGVGLASTRQRLAHLYGDRHAFAVRGAPGEGVHVTMAIPFHPFERTAAD